MCRPQLSLRWGLESRRWELPVPPSHGLQGVRIVRVLVAGTGGSLHTSLSPSSVLTGPGFAQLSEGYSLMSGKVN